jgi:hypothetical protein
LSLGFQKYGFKIRDPEKTYSGSQCCGSGSPTVLRLLFDFLSLKNDVIVPSKSNKHKNFLKVNDENSMDPRIRIRTKLSRIRNTDRSQDQKGHRIPDSQYWKNQKGNACLDSSRHRRRPDRHHTAAEDRMGSGPCPARPAAPCTRQNYSRAARLHRREKNVQQMRSFPLCDPKSRHITNYDLILGKYHNLQKDSSRKRMKNQLLKKKN